MRAKFSGPSTWDQLILQSLATVPATRISRAAALTVPNVVRGRNMLCSIATLPIVQLDRNNRTVDNPLFRQIDTDVPNVVTLAQTVEDLVFDSISWWEVTATDFDGFPIAARHRDVSSVSLNPPGTTATMPLPSGRDPHRATVWIDGQEVPASRVIRFDSPNQPILNTGAKAIRRALLLDAAASMYADDPRPLDYFTPVEGAEEIDDDEIEAILAKWKSWRKKRSTGFVPNTLQYNSVQTPTPQQMQLVELQKQAGIEIANLLGVDPEDLGISTTSRTYANDVDRRRNKVNDVLAPYMRAITDRLSMGDVTRRGHRVKFDLDDYLKSNPTERASVQKTYVDMGALLVEEVRADEGRPPLPPEARPAPTPPPPADPTTADPAQPDTMPEDMMNNSRPTRLTFDATGVRTLELAATRADFRVDAATRTIWGLAIPYNQVVEKWGMRFRFLPNSIEWSSEVSRVKFLRDHDPALGLGYAQKLTQTADGVQGKYKLGRNAHASSALMDAEDGIADGLSAGVEFDMTADTTWNERDQVYDVHRALMVETSLTAMPAFDDARVTKVAASRNRGGNAMEECATCGTRHAPGAACSTPQNQPANQPAPEAPEAQQPAGVQLSADQRRRILDNPGVVDQLFTQLLAPQSQPETQAAPQVQLSADQIGALMSRDGGAQIVGALLGVQIPAPEPERPQPVDPTRRMGATRVTEPVSYTFDRNGDLRPAAHDFGVDIIRALNPTFSDKAAEGRVMEFIRAQFDVVAADVNELNPTINVPRFIDQREFTYPIFSSVNRGAPPNGVQPFSWPKFSTAAGLVAVNAEGTEPASGTYVTTSQTVTPVALSGKAKISRQVWDMGGTPGLSDVLWRRITRDWYETIEARIVTALAAAGFSSLGVFTIGGGTGFATLVAEMTKYLAQLQFARGGFRFDTAFAQADLYGHLTGAVDTTGRPMFPVLGQTNANGQARGRWSQVEIGGVPFLPAWALAAAGQTNSTPSYLIDSTAVDCWATPPLRLTFDNNEVANVYVGVWGYSAEAVNDTAGGRTINYDPVAP